MGLDIARHVTEYDCAPLISHLKRRSYVKIHLSVAHNGSIDEKRLLVCRLAVFHIDLAGHTLDSVDHGRRSFCDLNALEPLSRYIRKSERC